MKLGRTVRAWLIGVAVAVVVAVGASELRPKGAEPSLPPTAVAKPAMALTVSVVRPERVEWPEVIQASGTITAWQEAIVGAEVVGLRLAELMVDVGDEVTKGQVLARFDDATTLAMVRQTESAVAEAEANVAEAEANAQRAERLGKTGALSQQDATQYLTRGRTAQAQLESAKARLHSQKLALDYTRVVAPDDGVISSRKAMLGMVAAPGTELFRLVRQNRLEWRAELTGAQLAQVQVGDVASVQLVDRTIAHGKVRQVAPVLDESTPHRRRIRRTRPQRGREHRCARGHVWHRQHHAGSSRRVDSAVRCDRAARRPRIRVRARPRRPRCIDQGRRRSPLRQRRRNQRGSHRRAAGRFRGRRVPERCRRGARGAHAHGHQS